MQTIHRSRKHNPGGSLHHLIRDMLTTRYSNIRNLQFVLTHGAFASLRLLHFKLINPPINLRHLSVKLRIPPIRMNLLGFCSCLDRPSYILMHEGSACVIRYTCCEVTSDNTHSCGLWKGHDRQKIHFKKASRCLALDFNTRGVCQIAGVIILIGGFLNLIGGCLKVIGVRNNLKCKCCTPLSQLQKRNSSGSPCLVNPRLGLLLFPGFLSDCLFYSSCVSHVYVN